MGGATANNFRHAYFLRIRLTTKLTTAITAKMKKRIFAISTAPAAIPPKPNTAAIKAMMKKTIE